MSTEDTSPEPPAGSSAPTGAPQQHAGPPYATSTPGGAGQPGPQPGGPGAPGGAPHQAPGQSGGPSSGPSGGPSSGMDGFFDTVRRIGISRSEDRWVGGVAGGVADRFGIDPLIVRGILVVSVFLTGAGLVLYGLAWALLPESRDGRIHLQQAIRGDFDVAMLGAAATTIVGLSWNNGWLSWWHFAGLEWLNGLLWTAAVVVVIVLVVNRRSDYRRYAANRATGQNAQHPGGPVPPKQPYPAQPFTGAPAQQGPPPQGWQQPRPPYGAPAPGAQPAPGVTYPAAPAAPSGPAYTASAPVPPPGYPAQRPVPPQAYAAQQAAAQQAARAHDHARRRAEREIERQRRAEEQRARAARRPRGPGTAVVGITLGVSLLGAAVLLLLERRDVIDVPFFYTWIGATIVLLGLGVIVSGLRGRTSGALGGLAIVATLIALPIAGLNSSIDNIDADLTARVSDATYTVTSVQDAENGFAFTFGNPVVDLSQLDLSTVGEDPVVVPIDLSAGDLTVIVPADTPVEAEVRVLAGNATWTVDGERRSINGVNTRPHTFVTDSVTDGAGPVLLLEVDVSAGDVTIREES
ncbi:PspC domain-containing protein [Oerskovia paurometabola]|uniref:PspC domain-containing protein n=1 Tax=Oerskovia paurometabola TaxID=162170 RepID=A0ABW1XH55_9CELL|nr:PspC domain-containing protein [Oerskovia paurometabola]MBM7496553.1 phage shock protein PspC (stress-responsive transcriptional regulator) [Oerskovia paurometabola]